MTLTDFLLARIAEDEAAARSEVAGVSGSPRRSGKARALRMARECEAKPAVLEEAQVWGCSKTMTSLLALPYADHPDYQQEWRP